MKTALTHLLFLDVETTGHDVNSRLDPIIEIAAALLRLEDLEIVDSFETLVRPEAGALRTISTSDGWAWELGEFHTKNGHFDGTQWAKSMSLENALGFLAHRFLPNATFAGQNPAFDVAHLQRDFAACGLPWPKTDYHMVDLASPAVFLVLAGKVSGVSLRHTGPWAHRILGLAPRPQKHRAMADVEDTIDLFRALNCVFQRGLVAGDFVTGFVD